MTDWTPAKIRELRHRMGLTQTQFGQRVGARLRTVQDWESGARHPSRSAQMLMEQILNSIVT